ALRRATHTARPTVSSTARRTPPPCARAHMNPLGWIALGGAAQERQRGGGTRPCRRPRRHPVASFRSRDDLRRRPWTPQPRRPTAACRARPAGAKQPRMRVAGASQSRRTLFTMYSRIVLRANSAALESVEKALTVTEVVFLSIGTHDT